MTFSRVVLKTVERGHSERMSQNLGDELIRRTPPVETFIGRELDVGRFNVTATIARIRNAPLAHITILGITLRNMPTRGSS